MEVSCSNGGDKQNKRDKGGTQRQMFQLFFSFYLIPFFLFFVLFQGFMHIGYMWVVCLGLASVRLMDKAEQGFWLFWELSWNRVMER